ncbi:SDR family NAD(P)-dependent oxidoreductase [Paenibacillus sp. NRS-1760]|uniref:SDR family NAD(P)-dependent oxidoreductase n=1 Tax=Paenibacillus sp. NRS-1760 TaxID=3233902 RepID=UPI003D293419
MIQVQNKWALVTGASSGIGEAFAHELAAKGSHLILTARSESKFVALAEKLSKKHGIQTEVIVSDLSKEGSPVKLYQECLKRGLSIDILINNAGFKIKCVFGYYFFKVKRRPSGCSLIFNNKEAGLYSHSVSY